MSDALCGPSNPLQQFKQQSQVDRSLQQDRLASRQSPGQGFRSHDPRAGLLDPEFEAFQAGVAPIDLPQLQPSHLGQGAARHGLAGPSQAPSWASDFQNLNINSGHVPQGYQPHHVPQNPAGWAQGFQQQLAQQAPRAYRSGTSPQVFQQRARYGTNGYGSYPGQANFAPTARVESKAPMQDHFDEAAFERAFEQARDELMPDASNMMRAPGLPPFSEIPRIINESEVKGLSGGPFLPMLRVLLVDILANKEGSAMAKPRIFQLLRLMCTVEPREISWMQRALTIPVLQHILKRDIQWNTPDQVEAAAVELLELFRIQNARLSSDQQQTADSISSQYAELLPKDLEVRSLPLTLRFQPGAQLNLAREGSIESQLFGSDRSLAAELENHVNAGSLSANGILDFDLNLTLGELRHGQNQPFGEEVNVFGGPSAMAQLAASTLQACRESSTYRSLVTKNDVEAQWTNGEPVAISSQDPMTAETAHPQLGTSEQQRQEESRSNDDDALAETAGELLEKVKHNKSDKFQNSQFLGLMRKLRDRETKVQGDKMVETNANSADSRDESLNASASIDSPYFDNSEQLPAPVRPVSPLASFDTRRHPERAIPAQEQDHDAGRIDQRDGQEVVDLLNQPDSNEAGNDIGTSEITPPPEAISHPRWWKRDTTLPDMLYGPEGALQGPSQ